MESHVVKTILFTFLNNPRPLFLIHRWITGLRETAALHRSTEINRTTIDVNTPVLDTYLTQSEGCLVIVIAKSDTHPIALGVKLIPKSSFLSHIHIQRHLGAIDLEELHESLFITINIFDTDTDIGQVIEHVFREATYLDLHIHYTKGDVGNNLHLLYIWSRRLCPQFYLSHDAIPVTLSLVCHAMRVDTYAYILDTIIHTNFNLISLARREVFGDIILMRSGE